MVQSSARAVPTEDRVDLSRPRHRGARQDQASNDKNAWWDRFRADNNSARTVQDKARTGRTILAYDSCQISQFSSVKM